MERHEIVVAGAGVEIEGILFLPAAPTAAIVLIHGWGGSAHSMVEPATEAAERGYLALSLSMRGWGESGGTDDCGLEQPDDIVAVVEWLGSGSAHPSLPIGLLGISQGGQVALLCAARCLSVAAVAAWAPVTDVARWRASTSYPGIPEYIEAACADGDFARRSPLSCAGRITAPTLLVHGDEDARVPIEQSRLLHEAITAAGGQSRLEILEGVGHSRGRAGNTVALDATFDFFANFLTARREQQTSQLDVGAAPTTANIVSAMEKWP